MTILPLGCEGAREGRVEVNGLRLRFLDLGEPGRPTLCLLHGGSAHAHWFDAITPAFADRGTFHASRITFYAIRITHYELRFTFY
jgi:pimeloyl-ACP methyl ester carboxylesterase